MNICSIFEMIRQSCSLLGNFTNDDCSVPKPTEQRFLSNHILRDHLTNVQYIQVSCFGMATEK